MVTDVTETGVNMIYDWNIREIFQGVGNDGMLLQMNTQTTMQVSFPNQIL